MIEPFTSLAVALSVMEAGAVNNAPDDYIANLDETTGHWLKLRAKADGSFQITNGRTGATASYGPRN